MTEAAPGCNAGSDDEGILDDGDPTGTVDKRGVEGHFGVLSGWLAGHELTGGRADSCNLAIREAFGGNRMGFGTLDLDEDQPRTVAGDEVNLSCPAAPPARGDRAAIAGIVIGHLILCHPAAVMRDGAPQPPAASFSAI